MLLDVKNLAVSYGKNSVPTIAEVSFDLNDGEILAIVGESGSGKTTVFAGRRKSFGRFDNF